jgi:hypothetical protein
VEENFYKVVGLYPPGYYQNYTKRLTKLRESAGETKTSPRHCFDKTDEGKLCLANNGLQPALVTL